MVTLNEPSDETTPKNQDPPDVLVERFESMGSWAELIRRRFVAFDITARTGSDLAGVVRTSHVGHLQVSSVASVPQTFTRTSRMAVSAEGQVLALGRVERGTGHFEQDGRRCTLSDGDFVLYETSRPLRWTFAGEWRFSAYMWPRESILLSEQQSRDLTGTKLLRSAGMGAILGPILDNLKTAGPGLSPAGAMRLASQVAELAIIAADEGARPERATEPDQDLRRIQAFIEENLADPTLTPAAIAQQFFMSTRTLHRLFGRHGLSVSVWIKRRRLEACRRALASSAARTVPITVLAARFGFPSQPFLSREFAAAYGVSPREYRDQYGH